MTRHRTCWPAEKMRSTCGCVFLMCDHTAFSGWINRCADHARRWDTRKFRQQVMLECAKDANGDMPMVR